MVYEQYTMRSKYGNCTRLLKIINKLKRPPTWMKPQSLVGFQTPTHLCLYWRNTNVWLNDCVRKSKALQSKKIERFN